MTDAGMTDAVVAIAGLEMQRGTADSKFRMIVDRLELESGQPVLLVGENGSGKSSLLDVIGLVLRPKLASRFVFHGREGDDADIAALFAQEKDAALTDIRCAAIG